MVFLTDITGGSCTFPPLSLPLHQSLPCTPLQRAGTPYPSSSFPSLCSSLFFPTCVLLRTTLQQMVMTPKLQTQQILLGSLLVFNLLLPSSSYFFILLICVLIYFFALLLINILLAKVNTLNLEPGDSVLFNKGKYFPLSKIWNEMEQMF